MSEAAFTSAALKAFKQNLDRTTKTFAHLSEAQLETRVAPNKNRLVYLWGHLIAVQDAMFPLLGLGELLFPQYEAVFIKSPDGASPNLPTAAELNAAWTAINEKLIPAFEAFTPAEWLERHTAVSPEDFAKEPHRNRYAILLSRTSHLAYHLGQAVLANNRHGHAKKTRLNPKINKDMRLTRSPLPIPQAGDRPSRVTE